jgi:hypothetical protein
MKTNRRLADRTSLPLVAALLFGCAQAGVKNQSGSGGGSGSGSGGSNGSSGSNGSGGSHASGGNNGSGGNNNSGGSNGSGGSSGTTDAGLDGACAASSIGAHPVPLDLYFLMDSSKSMADQTGAGSSKWTAVGSALNTFFNDSGSAGLGVALKYFPDEQSGAPGTCSADSQCGSYGPCDYRLACIHTNTSGTVDTSTQLCPNMSTTCTAASETCQRIEDCGTGNSPCVANGTGTCPSSCSNYPGYCHLRDICTASDYASPNVALGTLPGAAGGLNSSLTGHSPDGYTPTGPALAGAVMWAQQQQSNNPDHKVAIVLVTDGLPGGFIPGFPPAECAPSDIPGISSILSGVSGGANPILTFVVGIFNPNSLEGQSAPSNLMSLAQAGGTDSAVIIDVTGNTVTQQLHDALAKAQTKAIACSYQIPPSSGGTAVDFGKVNVSFTSGSNQTKTIGHTTGSSACSNGGWYYDVDPAQGTPTKIIACPSTCSGFQSDTNGQVQIVLGCQTINIG